MRNLCSGIQDIEEECRLTQDTKASRDARNITEVRRVIKNNFSALNEADLLSGVGLFARPLEHQETV